MSVLVEQQAVDEAGEATAGASWVQRTRALAAPVAVVCVGAAATALVAVRDPHQAGNYPSCPSIALFGVHCPGCGSMRAMHELAHGDLAAMIALNALVPVGLVLLAWAWLSWVDRRVGRGRLAPLQAPMPVAMVAIVVVVAFTVLRNLPVQPFAALAP